MFGLRVLAIRSVIEEAFEAYRPSPSRPILAMCCAGVISELIGAMPLVDPTAVWRRYKEARLVCHAPAGQDRHRSLQQAAINMAGSP